MSKAICGWHDKPICKTCHHCEDCGISACIHTERGRITKAVFQGINIGCDGRTPTNKQINEGKEIVEEIYYEKEP